MILRQSLQDTSIRIIVTIAYVNLSKLTLVSFSAFF
nr:MAG TPA: hypothetical protein [Caudoviricetes sp.]